jgi:hypothetical protein
MLKASMKCVQVLCEVQERCWTPRTRGVASGIRLWRLRRGELAGICISGMALVRKDTDFHRQSTAECGKYEQEDAGVQSKASSHFEIASCAVGEADASVTVLCPEPGFDAVRCVFYMSCMVC